MAIRFPGALAPYAADAARSRGRLHAERESAGRTVFARDRDRIIHAIAFRRLKHKTQVFVAHEGDHYRTRLTHSLEVSQIARALARRLRLDEDLAEAVALAHDLGHPPFGHAGEAALDACMAEYGGFDHNAQTLRILTKLERRYAAFDGLNLAWETLEGVVKHNGPVQTAPGDPLPAALAEYAEKQDLHLGGYPSLEAQIAALADDIAYNNHDVDDGLRAGLFDVPEILDVPIAGPAFHEVRALYPDLERGRLIHEAVVRMIGRMVDDLIAATEDALADLAPADADDVRGAGAPTARFSGALKKEETGLRAFLFENMYRHFKVNRAMAKAKRVVTELFGALIEAPALLPPEWSRRCDGPRGQKTARVVCDYIAGMTDRFAATEHRRLFGLEGWV
ncbi:MAG: deoxyguanosinetriphosphate triphosphohydrolase [Pseudomonadota bacterium]